jgi:O-antigen ligase/tetratricopeptide (TPR) repeat protein
MPLIKLFAFLIVLVTPFILQRAHTLSPAELPKQIHVTSAVLVLFILWVFAMARKKVTTLKWSHSLTLLGIWLGANTISYIFSISKYVSFWGDKNLPSDSLQTIIVFFILSFIFLQIFDESKDYKRFAAVVFLTMAGQIIVGLVQHYYLYTHWYAFGVVFGTMGVTVALANVFAAFFPVLLNCIFRSEKLGKLLLYYALLMASFLIMLHTSSRTPMAAAFVAFVMISTYELYVGFDRQKIKKILLIIFALAVTFSFFKFDVPDAEISQKMQPRLLNKAINSRAIIWESAFRAWKDHPLVGLGPEAFVLTQRNYQLPEANDYEYWNTEWAKPHNQIFQDLANTGILGLLSHLLILAYMTFFAAKSILKKQNDERSHWLRTFYMLYLVIFMSNMTCFNFMTTQMYSYLAVTLFGISQAPFGFKISSWPLSSRLRYLIAVLISIPSLSLAYATYTYGQADIYMNLGLTEIDKNANTKNAVNYYFKGLSYDENDPLLYCQVAYAASQMLINNNLAEKTYAKANKSYINSVKILSAEEKEQAFKQVNEFIEICLQKSDGKFHYYNLRSELYNKLYITGVIDQDRPASSFQATIDRFPNNPESYFKLGLIALREKDYEKFISLSLKAISLKKDYLQIYGELMNYYYLARDFDKIKPLVDEIEKLDFKSAQYIPTLLRLADLAHKNGDLISAKILLRKYAEYKHMLDK